jgi:hypothetical protein
MSGCFTYCSTSALKSKVPSQYLRVIAGVSRDAVDPILGIMNPDIPTPVVAANKVGVMVCDAEVVDGYDCFGRANRSDPIWDLLSFESLLVRLSAVEFKNLPFHVGTVSSAV